MLKLKLKTLVSTGVVALGFLLGGQAVSAAPQETGHKFKYGGTYDPNSLVDTLKLKGLDSDMEYRKELAKKYGIENYTGSEEQNVTLLNIIKGIERPVSRNYNKEKQKAEKTEEVEQQDNSKKEQGKTMTVEATAYTAYCNGCSGVTYTGIDLRANPNQKVIAVDPNVIPLGSKVYVEGYGEAVAGDIGGAIKGNRIDVFIPSKSDAYKWGRRTVEITILGYGK